MEFRWLLFSCSEKLPKDGLMFIFFSLGPLHSGSLKAASRPITLEPLFQSSSSETDLLRYSSSSCESASCSMKVEEVLEMTLGFPD